MKIPGLDTLRDRLGIGRSISVPTESTIEKTAANAGSILDGGKEKEREKTPGQLAKEKEQRKIEELSKKVKKTMIFRMVQQKKESVLIGCQFKGVEVTSSSKYMLKEGCTIKLRSESGDEHEFKGDRLRFKITGLEEGSYVVRIEKSNEGSTSDSSDGGGVYKIDKEEFENKFCEAKDINIDYDSFSYFEGDEIHVHEADQDKGLSGEISFFIKRGDEFIIQDGKRKEVRMNLEFFVARFLNHTNIEAVLGAVTSE